MSETTQKGWQPEIWYGVYDADGKPCAAYPHRPQAEVYATGFHRPCEIRRLTALPDLPPRTEDERAADKAQIAESARRLQGHDHVE